MLPGVLASLTPCSGPGCYLDLKSSSAARGDSCCSSYSQPVPASSLFSFWKIKYKITHLIEDRPSKRAFVISFSLSINSGEPNKVFPHTPLVTSRTAAMMASWFTCVCTSCSRAWSRSKDCEQKPHQPVSTQTTSVITEQFSSHAAEL